MHKLTIYIINTSSNRLTQLVIFHLLPLLVIHFCFHFCSSSLSTGKWIGPEILLTLPRARSANGGAMFAVRAKNTAIKKELCDV